MTTKVTASDGETISSELASTSNMLGLGVPPPSPSPSPSPASSTSGLKPTTSVFTTYPHLSYYLHNLLLSLENSPPRKGAQHPLSVSSSGESDDETTHHPTQESSQGVENPNRSSMTLQTPRPNVTRAVGNKEKEELVRRVVELLDNDQEEILKELLRPYLGTLGKDEVLLEQVCLDCMHRRRDDVENVPYAPHLTPTRPRASPAITVAPLRPFTPPRLPSFRTRTPMGRPLSPSVSANQTPTFTHTSALTKSDIPLEGSPLSASKMLNAKAITFNPSPRSISVPLHTSPFTSGASAMARTGSNLAIATPLFSDQSSPFHSPIGTPSRPTIKMPETSLSPPQDRPSSRGIILDDDDDEFSPFGTGLPKLHHHQQSALNLDAKPFEPGSSSSGHTSLSAQSFGTFQSDPAAQLAGADLARAEEDALETSTGMTPLDVLASVFTSVPRSELEDALHRAGYDFEGAMAILVAQYTQPRSGSSTPQRVSSPRPLIGIGGRGAVSTNFPAPRDGYFVQGGRTHNGNLSPGYGPRSPGGPPVRMCRYYLTGECRRSDCRFSHDLERALCRFWLRGHCAKGPNCEFLHHLPNGFDPSALTQAMASVELSSDGSARATTPTTSGYAPPDEFPDLLAARINRSNGNRLDPSRTRFANAVKRPAPGPVTLPSIQIAGSRFSPVSQSGSRVLEAERTSVPAVPRASARIALRPPTLLPTLQTGSKVNEQYMSTRALAIRLGHARNACLARAADAFRRGDGAAAKRFSREGKTLNERMLSEATEAAQLLVRERKLEAQKAARERDPSWSDDPLDRSVRGRECGGGLGVVLGVAGTRAVSGGNMLSAEERTEAVIDLHTLHGNEAQEILAQFLDQLELENFRGLVYVVVGEGKHVGTQDAARGASKIRLGASVRQYLSDWSYPWNETAGVICVDPCRN
ncbi:hypothetical protein TREMEDRAFT_45481 [Tremella mesenterica DSM 1558]|uniref:uncharacterized protein n=1 Tax=Tremella mesenterica (strain ATCC 24925 / CBS 8224 / DSM 1558 / NBRC 9311 / NRRL Y-6157 / RJB 2259-6 / UBC 559-6) TaxID=578456 RepID=UPI0003F4A4C5|nr:uncharacterized protein TREMEDRAFT_45481 [Tremella mesenterica DSM 1558]EIW67044.1 hypothetical protein TREMEDRAFT_45481 [Tremella mesenterica DSM 1558]